LNRPRFDWKAVVLVAALLAVWFGTLDHRALLRPDEGRYAEIPREMAATGDWLTPRLNAIKYFEKPPLQYWATASAYSLFGEHHWTARLWTALTGLGGILLAAFLGTRLWGLRAGIVAGTALAGTTLYNIMGHLTSLDMGLTFFLQLALTGFVLAQQAAAPAIGRRWMLLAWAGLAGAVLSKGLVALVLTGLAIVAYTAVNRDIGPWKRFAPLSGLLLFLAITAPWFVAVSLANPEFPHFFFIHEHFERFLTRAHRRYQPGGYFVFIYLVGALPFALLYLHGLLKAWGRRTAGQFSAERFLAVWVVTTFGFFSLSSSKLPPYILPIFPALALLLGAALAQISRRALIVHLSLLLLATLPMIYYVPPTIRNWDRDYSDAMLAEVSGWLGGSAVLWMIALCAALIFAWKQRRHLALTALGAGSLLAGTGFLLGYDALSSHYSGYESAEKIRPLLKPGVPFYSVQWYEQTIPFYLKRTVTLVAHKDEMAFGIAQEPNKWIPTLEEFKRRWQADPDAFALMPIGTFEAFSAEGLPMQEITRDQRNVYVRKPQ